MRRLIRYTVAGTLAASSGFVGLEYNGWFAAALGTAAIAVLLLCADPGAP